MIPLIGSPPSRPGERASITGADAFCCAAQMALFPQLLPFEVNTLVVFFIYFLPAAMSLLGSIPPHFLFYTLCVTIYFLKVSYKDVGLEK